jgi:hypothetical protein
MIEYLEDSDEVRLVRCHETQFEVLKNAGFSRVENTISETRSERNTTRPARYFVNNVRAVIQ